MIRNNFTPFAANWKILGLELLKWVHCPVTLHNPYNGYGPNNRKIYSSFVLWVTYEWHIFFGIRWGQPALAEAAEQELDRIDQPERKFELQRLVLDSVLKEGRVIGQPLPGTVDHIWIWLHFCNTNDFHFSEVGNHKCRDRHEKLPQMMATEHPVLQTRRN